MRRGDLGKCDYAQTQIIDSEQRCIRRPHGNIAEYHGMNYDMLAFDETEQVSVEYVDDYLAHNAEITHVAVVHCETTTGILNPLKEIAHMVKMHGKS